MVTQFTVKPLNDVISDLLLNVFNNIDDVTDGNVGGVLRQMLESIAQEISLLYDQLQNIFDGSRVDTAISTDLDQIGLLVGVTRKQGTNSTGNVTFFRNQVSPSDFTIAANSIISTQPNTGEEQFRYIVRNNTVFDAEIETELQRFREGIFEYPLNERLIDSIQLLEATVSATPGTALAENTDFEIAKNVVNVRVVDTSNIEIVDDNDTADFTENADATAEVLDATTKIQGSASLDLGKSGTASNVASYEKILGSVVDGTNKDLHLYLRIADQATLDKITSIDITYGSGGDASNSFKLSFLNSDLSIASAIPNTKGFQLLRIDRTSADLQQTGFPIIAAINFIKIDVITTASGDVISSGDVKMDFWFFAENSEFSGDLIRFLDGGTFPDDNTDIDVDYRPLSKEVLVDSEEVGSKFNVSKNKIVFKVSNIPNIDNINNFETIGGGSDVEDDETLRQRIKDSSLAGKATVEALRQAVLAVDGVTSVTVDDLPRKTATSEVQLFASGTDEYKLDFEVAQDNATLEVSATVSATPGTILVNGTDYVLSEDNEIVFQAAGTKPDDGTTFFVTYDYDHLGHVEIFISGVQAPLSASITSAVDTAVEDTRAAGVVVDVFEPTVVSVDVTATITVEEGFTAATVLSTATVAVRNFLNTLSVGQDVFVAELTRVIQETEGVDNSVITIPASDISIDVNEIAKAGTISIST